MIKKVAILTSGGDSPGMNTAIKAIVNTAIEKGLEPYLVYEGYLGLTNGNFKKVNKQDVKFIGDKGGTIIYSARFPEFKDIETRKKAVSKMEENGIDALIAIGGDGSYMGAAKLTEMGIKTIGLPGTIDNDIPSTDYTIGFHTALNTIVEAVDKTRHTAESHNRAKIIEVMGRDCGDLAIYSALATGAEVLSTSERKFSEKEIIEQVSNSRKQGNRSIIIIVTEHLYNVHELAQKIESETNIETRATILGYPQRGGVPTAEDRILATRMGVFAVEKLIAGETGVAVNLNNNKLETKDILEVVAMKRQTKDELFNQYDLIK